MASYSFATIRKHPNYLKARRQVLREEDQCGICGQYVDTSIRTPHPLSPEADHIIPLNMGGHPWDRENLQLSHKLCNGWKQDKLLVDTRDKTSLAKAVIQEQSTFQTSASDYLGESDYGEEEEPGTETY